MDIGEAAEHLRKYEERLMHHQAGHCARAIAKQKKTESARVYLHIVQKNVCKDLRFFSDQYQSSGVKKVEVKSGRLKVLTSDEVYEIHLASLEILAHVGVRVLEPKAFSVLKESGADVDQKEKIARIPEYLVKEAVRKAPNSFVLYGRNGNYKLRLGDKKTFFALPGTGVNVLDLETGKCRRSTLADVKNFYRLADALPNVHHASLAVEPTEISDPAASLYSILESFRNTTKTIDGDSYGENGSLDTIQLASIVAGGIDELGKSLGCWAM